MLNLDDNPAPKRIQFQLRGNTIEITTTNAGSQLFINCQYLGTFADQDEAILFANVRLAS